MVEVVGHELTDEELRALREQQMFDEQMQALLNDFKQTDWASTPIYKMFEERGRWVHASSDTDIYSEIEVKYLLTTLGKMFEHTNHKEEFKKTDGALIIS